MVYKESCDEVDYRLYNEKYNRVYNKIYDKIYDRI